MSAWHLPYNAPWSDDNAWYTAFFMSNPIFKPLVAKGNP